MQKDTWDDWAGASRLIEAFVAKRVKSTRGIYFSRKMGHCNPYIEITTYVAIHNRTHKKSILSVYFSNIQTVS